VDNTNSSADAAVISGVISGAANLQVTGAGILSLTATTNNYGGTNFIGGATVRATTLANAGTNSSLGTNASIVITNGGVLEYVGTTNTSMNRVINLASGNGGIGVSNSAAELTISGAISNTGSLVKSGAGTLTLTASNTYGGTTISAGSLKIGTNGTAGTLGTGAVTNNGSLIFHRSDNVSASNVISGSGGLTKLGLGTLVLSGNSSFTGTTIISNGAVRVSNANGLGATNGGTTVIAGAALEVDGGIAIGAEALTLNNNGISSGGSLRSISGANTYGGAISLGTGVVVGVDADSLTLNGGVAPGAGSSFTKVGAGTLILNSTSTATGIVTISGGTMQLGTNGAIAPVAMNVTNGSTFDLNGRNATLGSPLNLNVYLTGATLKSGAGTISLNAAGVTVHSATNANSSTISGNLNLGGVTNTFNVADGAAAEDLVVSAAVSNGGLIKTNTGLMSLTASNSFTGATTVGGGTLKLDSSSGSSLGSSTNVTVGSGATLLIAQSNQVNNSAAVTLSGGTIRTAAGVTETFGNLTVSSASFLDFGATFGNASSMNFGTYAPSFQLSIDNFNFGSTLTFKTDLTSFITNSSLFAFSNGGISSFNWNAGTSTFTITAIPEPSTYVAAIGLLALMLWPSAAACCPSRRKPSQPRRCAGAKHSPTSFHSHENNHANPAQSITDRRPRHGGFLRRDRPCPCPTGLAVLGQLRLGGQRGVVRLGVETRGPCGG
jgi:fibronectin-binding autotransporter adhesin